LEDLTAIARDADIRAKSAHNRIDGLEAKFEKLFDELRSLDRLAVSIEHLAEQVASYVEKSVSQGVRIGNLELVDTEMKQHLATAEKDIEKYSGRIRDIEHDSVAKVVEYRQVQDKIKEHSTILREMELADGKKWRNLTWLLLCSLLTGLIGIALNVFTG